MLNLLRTTSPWVAKPEIIMEQLEERIVFDASVANSDQNNDDASQSHTDSTQTSSAETTTSPEGAIQEAAASDGGSGSQQVDSVAQSVSEIYSKDLNVVLISNAINQIEAIKDAVAPDAQVVVYDAAGDTLATVVSRLEALSDSTGLKISHLAIVSEGQPGAILLDPADDVYSLSNMSDAAPVWMQLSQSLASGARIDLYGCNIGQGETGLSFVSELSNLTQSIVWASDDDTGNVSGADWVFEVQTAPDSRDYLLDAAALVETEILFNGQNTEPVPPDAFEGITDVIRFENADDTLIDLDPYFGEFGSDLTYSVELIDAQSDLINGPFAHYLSENPLNANDPNYPTSNPYQWYNANLFDGGSPNLNNATGELTLDYANDQIGVNLLKVTAYSNGEPVAETVFSVAVLPVQPPEGEIIDQTTQTTTETDTETDTQTTTETDTFDGTATGDANDNSFGTFPLPDNSMTIGPISLTGDIVEGVDFQLSQVNTDSIQFTIDGFDGITSSPSLQNGDQILLAYLADSDAALDYAGPYGGGTPPSIGSGDVFVLNVVSDPYQDGGDPSVWHIDVSLTAFDGLTTGAASPGLTQFFDYDFAFTYDTGFFTAVTTTTTTTTTTETTTTTTTTTQGEWEGFANSTQDAIYLGSDVMGVQGVDLIQGDPTTSVAIGDVDNDGDLDIVVGIYNDPASGNPNDPRGTWGNNSLVYRNDGLADPNDPSSLIFTLVEIQNSDDINKDRVTGVALGDLNNDGLMDLVRVGVNQVGVQAQDVYQLNLGDIDFTDSDNHDTVEVRLEGYTTSSTDPADIYFLLDGSVFYLNEVGDSVTTADGTFTVIKEGLNAGDLGVFQQVYGDTTKFYVELSFDPAPTYDGVVNYDMFFSSDGVTFTDLTPASDYQTHPSLWLGFGTPEELDNTAQAHAVSLGDLNGDGWLDIAVGTNTGMNIYINNGDPNNLDFTLFEVGISTGQVLAVDIGDVNADGHLDIFAGLQGPDFDLLFLNQGDGVTYDIYAVEHGTDHTDTRAVDLIDLDASLAGSTFIPSDPAFVNDIDSDVVVGYDSNRDSGPGAVNYYYLNLNDAFSFASVQQQGKDFADSSLFVPDPISTTENHTYGIQAWDLNQDGIFDVLVGNSQKTNTSDFTADNPGNPLQVDVYHLGALDSPLTFGGPNSLGLGITYYAWKTVPNQPMQLVAVDINDASWPLDSQGNFQTHAVFAADFNGDGLPDVFLGNSKGFDLLLINQGFGTETNTDTQTDTQTNTQTSTQTEHFGETDTHDVSAPAQVDFAFVTPPPPPIPPTPETPPDVPGQPVLRFLPDVPEGEVLRQERGFELEAIISGIISEFDATFTPRPTPPSPGFLFPYPVSGITIPEIEFGARVGAPPPTFAADLWEFPEYTDAGADLRPDKGENVRIAEVIDPVIFVGPDQAEAIVFASIMGEEDFGQAVESNGMMFCYAGGPCSSGPLDPNQAEQLIERMVPKVLPEDQDRAMLDPTGLFDMNKLAFTDIANDRAAEGAAPKSQITPMDQSRMFDLSSIEFNDILA